MSLDVVRPKDVPTPKGVFVKNEDLSLKTEDIDFAKPHYRHLNHLNKPDLSVGSTHPEHAGARARTYYPPMDRRPRDMNLTTMDIEGSRSEAKKHPGNRHTDPLCPDYELPSHVVMPQTPPRFNGRHTNDIADIEHTTSKVLHPDRSYSRNPNESRDIEFNEPNYQERVKRPYQPRPDRQLDVQDIMGKKPPASRCTNPLDPVYKLPVANVTSLHTRFSEERGSDAPRTPPGMHRHIGEVHGSKPRRLHRDNGEPQLSLVREDIAGTVPQRFVGSIPANIYDSHDVRPMVEFHDPHDIPGAHVGSLKKGIHSRREVNPLNPQYTMLDGDPGRPPHPMLHGRGNAQSASDLHGTGGVGATPAGSSRGLQRVSSAGSMRHIPAAGVATLGGGARQSDIGYQSQTGMGGRGAQIGTGTFQPQMGMGGYEPQMGMGETTPGMMSRRSNASSAMGSQRCGQPCY